MILNLHLFHSVLLWKLVYIDICCLSPFPLSALKAYYWMHCHSFVLSSPKGGHIGCFQLVQHYPLHFSKYFCACLLVHVAELFVLVVDLLSQRVLRLQLCLVMSDCSPKQEIRSGRVAVCITLLSNLCQTLKGNIIIFISLITGEVWHLCKLCHFKWTLLWISGRCLTPTFFMGQALIQAPGYTHEQHK